MEAIKRIWTVWRFQSPSSGEVAVIAKPMEPGEIQHEYQRILGHVSAFTAEQAVKLVSAS
jgi:ABC-type molybdenum transport system ATPase subunit/photorepair protein PhrA